MIERCDGVPDMNDPLSVKGWSHARIRSSSALVLLRDALVLRKYSHRTRFANHRSWSETLQAAPLEESRESGDTEVTGECGVIVAADSVWLAATFNPPSGAGVSREAQERHGRSCSTGSRSRGGVAIDRHMR